MKPRRPSPLVELMRMQLRVEKLSAAIIEAAKAAVVRDGALVKVHVDNVGDIVAMIESLRAVLYVPDAGSVDFFSSAMEKALGGKAKLKPFRESEQAALCAELDNAVLALELTNDSAIAFYLEKR